MSDYVEEQFSQKMMREAIIDSFLTSKAIEFVAMKVDKLSGDLR